MKPEVNVPFFFLARLHFLPTESQADADPQGGVVSRWGQGEPMARILGVGGVFFRARNPEKLGDWYKEWLGVPISHPHGAIFKHDSLPPGGFTVWAPFDQDTTYFNPSEREFMFNLIVDNLDDALLQVQEGGARVVGEIEEHEFGRFGWFLDPQGNKVELWQPTTL